jgi:hypothetical protein
MLRLRIHRVLPLLLQCAAVLTQKGGMFLALGLNQSFHKASHLYQSTAKLRMCEALLLVSLHGIVSRFCDNLCSHCQYICCIKSSLVLLLCLYTHTHTQNVDLAVHRSISFNFCQLSCFQNWMSLRQNSYRLLSYCTGVKSDKYCIVNVIILITH